MSLSTRLIATQQYMTRYGITTYVILGDIGLLFNIFIFSQPMHRRIPSSLYLLVSSICAFLALNFSSIPVIYQLDYYSAAMNTSLYCQLHYYFRQGLNLLFRIFFIIACADRYALLSENPRIRSFSQYKIAVRIIPIFLILFLLISIIPTMTRAVQNGKCDVKNGIDMIIYSIYMLLVVGLFPLCSAAIFIILIKKNLKRIRSRVQPITSSNFPSNQVLRKRDRDMLKMLMVEIVSYTATSTPIVIVHFYNAITQTYIKSDEQQRIETFVRYIFGVFVIFGSCALSFWIYICSSKSFRLEVKYIIMKCYGFITCKQIIINEIN